MSSDRRPATTEHRGAGTDADLLVATDVVVNLGRRTVLRGVSAHVRQGEILGLVGINGSGKTTLLRAVIGRVRLRGGRIRLAAGVEVGASIGSPAFLEHGTLRENLGLVLERPDLEQALEEAGGLGLPTNTSLRTFSTGMRQRAAILRAGAGDVGLVLLDEPDEGLDDDGRSWLCDRLGAAQASGVGAIVVSHDRDWLSHVASRIVRLHDGVVAS